MRNGQCLQIRFYARFILLSRIKPSYVKDKIILQIAGRVTGDSVDKGSIINLFTFDTTVM